MAKTCPGCGYNPIGPYTDNCPLCGESVRDVGGGPSGTGGMNLPPALIAGWIAIAAVVYYLFAGDLPSQLLSAAMLGVAWWLVARRETTLLLRIVGGSLVGLFVLGIVLASQSWILPGLEARPASFEQMMREIQALGISPNTIRMHRRMKTIAVAVYVLHAVVVVPLALCVPPLLSWRRQRQLGGQLWLSRPQARAGLVALPLLLVGLVWMSSPILRQWIEPPANTFPDILDALRRPQGLPPDDGDEKER